MRNTNMKKQTTKSDFFIRRVSGTWAILDMHGEVLDSGFASEAAAADFIVRFCQDHRMLYAIYY
ncbi:MAG: hypothetical protein KatS3mg082_1890 [Nitrospiraceae bacterium]|nr:MAG: hypothetical protein KatS3mg082_1890 [Nitrospiraceae bacterium]